MILGDHPGTKQGLPVTIDWHHQSIEDYDVDMYEFMRKGDHSRSRKKFQLKHDYRREYLTSLNMYTSAEFVNVLMEIHSIKESRMLNAGVQDFGLFDDFFGHSGKALKWSRSMATNGVNIAYSGIKNGTTFTVNSAVDGSKRVANLGVNGTIAVAKGTMDATKFTVNAAVDGTKKVANLGIHGTKAVAKGTLDVVTTAVDATKNTAMNVVGSSGKVLVKVGTGGAKGIKKFISLPAEMINSVTGVAPADTIKPRRCSSVTELSSLDENHATVEKGSFVRGTSTPVMASHRHSISPAHPSPSEGSKFFERIVRRSSLKSTAVPV